MGLLSDRLEEVNTRLFPNDDTFVFPELDSSHADYLGPRGQVGVCFSGGGTRSASCTHGQLRALDDLGLIDRIGYISCVSGGSWASLPYTYLSEHWEDSQFLGPVLEPDELSMDALEEVNERNFLHTVTNAGIVDDMIQHWASLAGDETYSRAVGDVFLKKFRLHSLKMFFAYSNNHLQDILQRNPNMRESDFYTTRPGRPFLIATGALLRPGPGDILFEMTPWYSGIHTLYSKAGSKNRDIGGGYIESFAMDSDSPDKITGDRATVRIGKKRHRFTLTDVVGTSGAAPSEVLNNLGLDFVGLPEFKHWPLSGNKKTKAKEYEIGDGGNLENLGIFPLLKRGVKRLVVFVNTKKPMSTNKPSQINAAVKALFEPGYNQVFPESDLQVLRNALLSKVASGNAVLTLQEHTTLENAHFGIPAGETVKVLWVYNNLYGSWKEKLPTEVSARLMKGILANFPHYETFGENAFRVIDLHPLQANLLSHMSCSVVRDNADVFKAPRHRGPAL